LSGAECTFIVSAPGLFVLKAGKCKKRFFFKMAGKIFVGKFFQEVWGFSKIGNKKNIGT
jgi:hypothetical protein